MTYIRTDALAVHRYESDNRVEIECRIPGPPREILYHGAPPSKNVDAFCQAAESEIIVNSTFLISIAGFVNKYHEQDTPLSGFTVANHAPKQPPLGSTEI